MTAERYAELTVELWRAYQRGSKNDAKTIIAALDDELNGAAPNLIFYKAKAVAA